MTITRFGTDEAIPEESDGEYTCTFHDAGAAAPALDADAILTMVATLSDVQTGTVINSRDDQDVLNVNGGALTEAGVFTLRLIGNVDNISVTDGQSAHERHRLTLKVTYQRPLAATGYLNHEVLFYVLRLHDVETTT